MRKTVGDRDGRSSLAVSRRLVAALTAAVVLAWAMVLTVAPAVPTPAVASPEAGPGNPLTGVAQIAVGGASTSALLSNGEVMCWGYNGSGQLGDGTTTNRVRPGLVSNRAGTGPLTGVTAISINGGDSACARKSNGTAVCWGWNGDGQLGDGTTSMRTRPVAVSNARGSGPLTGVASISAGRGHTCARLTNGWVACWGRNNRGQLGIGTTTGRRLPTLVYDGFGTAPLTVSQVDAGTDFTCARLPAARAACWGHGRAVGAGSRPNRLRPVLVSNGAGTGPLLDVDSVSTGRDHVCARRTTRKAACWGHNAAGESGDGTYVEHLRPVVVRNADNTGSLTSVAQVAAGAWTTCARFDVGWVACWGRNEFGQLGTGSEDAGRPLPTLVLNTQGTGVLGNVASIDSGGWYDGHTCALLTNAMVLCWGENTTGQLGDGTTTNRGLPVLVTTG